MSEYRAFVTAAMREGHSMAEAAAAWRRAHGDPRTNPYSPEGHKRHRRNEKLRELLLAKMPFRDALAIAEAEGEVIQGVTRPVTREARHFERSHEHRRRNPDSTMLVVLAALGAGYWWLSRNPAALGGLFGSAPPAPTTGGGATASSCSPSAPYISYAQWWTRYINSGTPPASGSSFPNIMVQDCPPALISPWLGTGAAPGFPRF